MPDATGYEELDTLAEDDSSDETVGDAASIEA